MRPYAALSLAIMLALPADAATPLSEVSGNWAGASNQGFFFLARLSQNEDMARLQIWGGAMDGVPAGDAEPELDNPAIALGAFASRQELRLLESETGTILQVETDFADEYAEGTTILGIQFLDNQYTVVSFSHHDREHESGGDYACDLDFLAGTATENGISRALPEMAFEDLNASGWTYGAAFDRGYCSVN